MAVFELLLKNYVNSNIRWQSGQAFLIYAARNGRLMLVQGLLEHGVNVDSKDNSGRTPLSYATAKNGHLIVIKLLCLRRHQWPPQRQTQADDKGVRR